MARGRPALDPEEKARRKEDRLASKFQGMADNALAKLPAEQSRRDELFAERDAIKSKQQEAAGDLSAHIKRMSEVFGLTKPAIRIRDILRKCRDGEYEATVQQVKVLVEDMGRPFQLSMFEAKPGQGVAEDTGSLFDGTSAGERQAAERGDDPGRANKRAGGPPPAPVDTGKLSDEEALARFEAANAAKAGTSADDDGDPDLRPRFLQGQPDPEPEVKAPRRQRAPARVGLGPDAIH
jgi:hypothetical protein